MKSVTHPNLGVFTRGRKPSFTRTSFFGFALVSLLFILALSLAASAGLFVSPATPASAVTTVPTKMNFQGRLADSTGNIKPNGTYNMRLKLYTVSSAGTAVWSEDRLVSGGTGVPVTNGLFSIQLGSVTTLPASLFASGALYLEVEFPTPATATTSSPTWTEGAMSPRNQMATSAYAYNSELLDGQDGSYYQDAVNMTGTVANARLTGSYTGITGTGALSAGSIGSGFGAILTGNTIQGSQLIAKATATNAATLVLQKTDGSIGLEVRTGGLADNTIYLGKNSGVSRTTGVDNLGFGSFALQSNTTGSYNSAFGNYALQSNISGQGNIAFGGSALNINTTGSNNVAFGTEALYNSNTDSNTAVGFRALKTQTTGDGNTAIGFGADVSTGSILKSTAIGYNAKVSASNSLVLGGTGADSVQVGIGTTAPAETLDVQGGNIRTSGRLISTVATGTAPITVASTTKVTNLNADLLDGLDSTAFGDATAANQTTILNRIGTNADAAGTTTLFARLASIDSSKIGATGDAASGVGSIFARLAYLVTSIGATTDAASSTGSVNAKLAYLINNPSSPTSMSFQTFDISGTWTKPAGAKKVEVQIWGGGGGGSGGISGGTAPYGGGGGGGGYYTATYEAASLGATVSVTVGSGGTGGTNGGGAGGNGTDSLFHTAKANGGFGGQSGSSGGGGGKGGGAFGGVAGGNGTFAQNSENGGGGGGASYSIYNVAGQSENGGGGGGGGGAVGGISNYGGNGGAGGFNSAGTTGTVPAGGGGSGHTGPYTGGAGAKGRVIVITYF